MDNILGDQPKLDADKKFFDELVGENKRYKDQEALARSKLEGDAYIKVLETRADEMREDFLKANQALKERASLEELIDRMNKPNQRQLSDSDTNANDGNVKPAIDPTQISEIVKQQLRAESAEAKANANVKIVVDRLKEQFGEDFQTKVRQKIGEIGLSQEDFNLLARNSPNALLRTLELEQQQQLRNDYQPPPRTSERRDSFSPKGADERTWSWWQNLRQTDPTSYYSGKMTVLRMDDSARLGSRFEDGNYEVLGRDRVPPEAVPRRTAKS